MATGDITNVVLSLSFLVRPAHWSLIRN